MEPKALSLLSIARKGRNIEAGEEPVGAACRGNHARLVVVAGDAGEHTKRRAAGFVSGTKQPCIVLDCTKEELGGALGLNACAMAAITDVRLALAFVEALGRPEENAELLQDLAARSERVAQRQREERAHEKNLRHGGKKKKS